MCLTTKQIEPMVAEEDIVCYKVVEVVDEKNGLFYTPYRHTKISQEIINGEELLIPKEDELFQRETYVNGGCIHSYAHKDVNLLKSSGFTLYKCIIPKGALYFKGNSADYASSALRFIEVEQKYEDENYYDVVALPSRIEDIIKLDWDNEIDRHMIVTFFTSNGFIVPNEPMENVNTLAQRFWEGCKIIKDFVIVAIIYKAFIINPDIKIDYQYAFDLYQKYLNLFPNREHRFGLDSGAEAVSMVVDKITGRKRNNTDYFDEMIKWAEMMKARFKEEGLV